MSALLDRVAAPVAPSVTLPRVVHVDDAKRLAHLVLRDADPADAAATERAAHRFLAARVLQLRPAGGSGFQVVESYVAPVALAFPGGSVGRGSHVVVVEVKDPKALAGLKRQVGRLAETA